MSISKKDAAARFKQFSKDPDSITYKIFLKLHKGKLFEGSVEVIFSLESIDDDVYIEFVCSKMIKIVFNGQEFDSTGFNSLESDGNSIILPYRYLLKGPNKLIIEYIKEYDTDGYGLFSCTIKNEQYVYSKCEPSFLSRIIPCFDQPDLKANFQLTLAYPKEWIAISNENIAQEESDTLDVETFLKADEINRYSLTRFNQIKKINTYLFAVAAGNFEQIVCNMPFNGIPMSLYCRKNLATYGKQYSNIFFQTTIQGTKFFEEYFGAKYAFSKYDHVILPNFKFGAMENIGMVTYFEDTIVLEDNKKEPTLKDRTELVRLILHELAHMWFGNLVTLRWWDDLWLNESFADFMSYLALDKIRDKIDENVSDAWVSFLARKNYGYMVDQTVSSHPICCDVKYALDSIKIFDGISYAKGAAVLRQLQYLIGEKNFEDAIKFYLKTYEYSNADLSDFLCCLEKYYDTHSLSAIGLNEWKEQWLQTSGFNTCTPKWEPKFVDSVLKIEIVQGCSYHKFQTLRSHKIKIGFFNKLGEVYDTQDVMIQNKESTIIEYKGNEIPEAILLNYDDMGFVKVFLDDISAEYFFKNITKIPKSLTRYLVWKSFYDALKIDEMAFEFEFLKSIESTLKIETDEYVIDQITNLRGLLKKEYYY